MARKKKEQILSPEELESGLRAGIEEAEKTADPAAQMLKYQALAKEYAGTYNKGDVIIPIGSYKKGETAEQSYIRDSRDAIRIIGTVTGLVIGAFVFGGLSAGLLLPVLGAMTLGGLLCGIKCGNKFGPQWGKSSYEKKFSPEQRHATRMLEMMSGMNDAMAHLLCASSAGGIKTRIQPPHHEAAKTRFSRITAPFNFLSAIAGKRKGIAARNDNAPRQLNAPGAGR